MDINLELDTRYHERKKANIDHKEKKPEASKSNSSHPHSSSSSNQKKKRNFQKRDKRHSSFLNKEFKLINSEKKEESRRAYLPILGGRIVLILVSKGLKKSLPNFQANFPAREKPE
ncbi:hypothetical protein O181_092770 [Austropuccinia psidii MF-1]|uniref:Uncharacterized protein n=1 Tax=Austropuccinia psidii MF-1 TaxID=1389203 RepID=A0A9Q3P9G8_9BASI|nr:hypothetical protein [Austropuccinia psidii MF-1]